MISSTSTRPPDNHRGYLRPRPNMPVILETIDTLAHRPKRDVIFLAIVER